MLLTDLQKYALQNTYKFIQHNLRKNWQIAIDRHILIITAHPMVCYYFLFDSLHWKISALQKVMYSKTEGYLQASPCGMHTS